MDIGSLVCVFRVRKESLVYLEIQELQARRYEMFLCSHLSVIIVTQYFYSPVGLQRFPWSNRESRTGWRTGTFDYISS